MKKAIALFLLVNLTLVHQAFSQDSAAFQTTSSGLLYRIYSDEKGDLAREGDFLKCQVLETVHDSVLISTYWNMPVYMQIASPHNSYSPAELYTRLRKGDSAFVAMPVADIRRHMSGQLPGFLWEKDTIFMAFKVLDVFRNGQGLEADSVQEVARQQQKEVRLIEAFICLTVGPSNGKPAPSKGFDFG